MKPINLRYLFVVIPSGIILFASLALLSHPVFAADLINTLSSLIQNKAGFQITENGEYIFSKDTPNYTAFAGDIASAGGHRIALAQDKNILEFQFSTSALTESSSAANVAGSATESAVLTPSQLEILSEAEQILERQASASGNEASESAARLDESNISTKERAVLDSAELILSGFGQTTASSSATKSSEPVLSQEQSDFSLLVRLKVYKVNTLSADIDKKLADIKKDVGAIVSKAQLVDETNERKVAFNNIVNTIDMIYRLDENGIDQDIILHDRTSIQNTFSFTLQTHGLTYNNLGNHGSWYFSDSLGYVMRFIHGWAMDAAGKFTNDVTTDITKTNGKDTVTMMIPDSWLSDPSRVYPVTLHTGLEIVPELRTGHPGAAEARALRTHSVVVPTELITPTLIATPSATPIATSSATPTIIMATPEASDSGVLEATPSATPTSGASGSGVLNWFNLVPQVFAAEPTPSFARGVLAVNTDKSVYTPGEQVLVQIASLDAAGHTLCTSNLKLEITDPKNTATDTRISRSPTCGDDNVTDTPDYTALYHVGNVGTYHMRVTNLDTGLTRDSSFEVQEHVSFEITRTAATRINPFKSDYKMTINVKANQNFDGYIQEKIPDNFIVVDSKASWHVHLKTGEEKSFSYTYRAPKISPQLYFLGSLAIGDFRENRQWQIASDACQQTGSGTWSGGATFAAGCSGVASLGPGTGNRPGAGDAVTTAAGITLTVDVTTPVLASYTSTAWNTTTSTTIVTVNTGVEFSPGALTMATPTSNSTATLSVAGTGKLTVSSLTMNAASNKFTKIDIAGTGTFNLNGAITWCGAGTCTLSTSGAATINLSGGSIPVKGSGTATVTLFAGTTLTSTGASSIGYGTALSWGPLSVTGGTLTLNGANETFTTVSVSAGAVLKLGGFTFTASSSTDIYGSINCPAAATCTGLKTFTGTVTVESGGAFDLLTGAPSVVPTTRFDNNISMQSGASTFNTNTGATTIGTSLTLSGGTNMTFGATTINSGVTLTNSVNNSAVVTFVSFLFASAPASPIVFSLSDLSNTTVTGAITYAVAGGGQNESILMNGDADLTAASISMPAMTAAGSALLTCVSSCTGTLTTTGAVTITGNSTASQTGVSTIAMDTANMSVGTLLTIAGGSVTAATLSFSTGNLTLAAGITFKGTAGFAKLTTTAGNTITFSGTSSWTNTVAPTLTIDSNTMLKTTGAATLCVTTGMTWPGKLWVYSGTTSLALAETISGTTEVTGALADTSGATLKTFTGHVTIHSGGSVDFTVGTDPLVSFVAGVTTETGAGSVNFGTGATTFTANQTLDGPVGMTFGATTINSGVTLTNSVNNSAVVTFVSFLFASAPASPIVFSLSDLSNTTVTGAITYAVAGGGQNESILMNGDADLTAASISMPAMTAAGSALLTCVSSCTGTLTTTGAVTITGNSTASQTGVSTIAMDTANMSVGTLLTIAGGSVTAATLSFSTGNLTITNGITFSGTAGFAKLTTTDANTITFTGNWTNTVAPSLTIDPNTMLKTKGAVTLCTTTGMTWPGNLWVSANTTTLGAVAMTFSGTTEVTGALANANSATAKTFNGLITIHSGGSVALTTTTNPAVNIGAGVTTETGAGSVNFGAGATAFTANQSLSGPVGMTFGAVTINSGATLTNSVNNSAVVTMATLALAVPASPNGMNLSDGSVTNVTGTTTFSTNTTTNDQVVTLYGNADFNPKGNLIMTGVPNNSGSNKIICDPALSGTSANVNVTGTTGIVNASTAVAGRNVVDLSNCSAGVFSSTSTITITGNANGTTNAELEVGSGGTITAGNGITTLTTAAKAVITTASTSVINLTGALTIAGQASLANIDPGTNLKTGVSGNASIASAMTWPGKLETFANITTIAGVAVTISGTTTVDVGSTFTLSNASGAKIFTGDVTVNGVWNESALAIPNFAGNLINNATTWTGNSGVHTFSGTGKTISGTQVTTMPNITVSGTVTNAGTVTCSTALIGGGTFTNGDGSTGTLNYGGAGGASFNVTGFNASATGNTVKYTAAAQTGRVVTYNNLTLSGSGAKTFATSPTVNGILSMEGTATVAVTAGIVTYGSSATLQYNTTTGRTATSEEWITPFAATGGVIIASTGLITLDTAKVFNASVPLTINSGAALNTGNFQLTFNDNFINNGGTFTAGSSPIVITGTDSTQSIAGFSTTGAVSMTKTAGTATFTDDMTADSLTLNGVGGSLNLGASLSHTINGTVSLTNGTLDGGSSTIALTGDWAVTSGSFTASTSTVNLNGGAGSTETISGTNTFYTLTATTTSARTIKFPSSTTTTITHSLTLTGSAGPTYLTLAPSITSTVWTMAPPVTQSVDFVDVSYSTATSCINMIAGDSHDGTHNTLWDFTGGSCANNAPDAPSLLFANEQASGAQSGEPSPVVALGDATPALSAVYNDNDAGDHAINYEIIVYSDACSTQVWDSGEQSLVACDIGNRCQDITFGGTTPLPFDGSTYHWKIKYWDSGGLDGSYSNCADNFSIVGPGDQMRHGNYFFNNSTKRVYTW